MNTSDNSELEAFVPVYDSTPEKWEDARGFITEQLKRIANAVNIREIGWFLDEELISGKQFIPAVTPNSRPQQFRTVFRKVIDFGTLPNAGIKSVPHGINFDNTFTLVQLYGAATQPSTFGIPLPYVNSAAKMNDIELYMDKINVNVVTGIDRTAFTRSFIVIEYMQQINEP